MLLELLDLRSEARRAMPLVPSLDGVSARLREDLVASARATWHGRMVNEHGSAVVFEGLARQLARAGFAENEVRAAETFAREERRHGVLCGAVVEALGGEAVAEVEPAEEFPTHEDVDAIEGVVRNLLSVSCLSETVAVALIGAEREEMPEGPLRDLLTRIWADEIGHARFGWAIVGREVRKMDAAARARLGAYLAVALAHVERHELRHLNAAACPPRAGAAWGLCNGADARSLFYATVETVILPRLAELGLDAERAWATREAA